MKKLLCLLLIFSFSGSFGQTKKKTEKETVVKTPIIEKTGTNENHIAEPVSNDDYNGETVSAPDNAIYNLSGIQVKPEFPGGEQAMKAYIKQRYIMPENLMVGNFHGKIYMSVTVEKDGSLTGLRILREICDGSGKELLRIVRDMPKWSPGKQDGKEVRCMAYVVFEIIQQDKSNK